MRRGRNATHEHESFDPPGGGGQPPARDPTVTRPLSVRLLVVLLVFQGLSGLAGGVALSLDPTGTGIGLDPAWLDGSPFPDYGVPGVFLLVVLGLGPLGAALLVIRDSPWAWSAALLTGLVLVAWILVEIGIVGLQMRPPLQLVYGLLGVGITALALHPTVREHLREPVDGAPDGHRRDA